MRNVRFDGIARGRCFRDVFRSFATILLAFCALMLIGNLRAGLAQDTRPGSATADAPAAAPAPAKEDKVAAPAGEVKPAAAAQDAKVGAAPAPPAAPSPGKALVYIYRVGRFVGSAAHDHLFINGVYLAYLMNGEYAWMEVDPGTAVVTGMPEMYYGSLIQSAGAALNEARKKENERAKLDVEAGKTYYLKWTSGTMATGIKVTLQDAGVGAKEMSKLHPSKPVVQPDDKTKSGWK